MKKSEENLIFFQPKQDQSHSMPLAHTGVSAGFPSPADDFKELRISIDQEVVKNEEDEFDEQTVAATATTQRKEKLVKIAQKTRKIEIKTDRKSISEQF